MRSRKLFCLHARKATFAAITLLTLAVGVGTPTEARANGYLTARFGGDHGTPAMANTYAVYYNPAALGGTTGTTITADVSLALRYAHYKRPEEALSPSTNASDRLRADQGYVAANTGDGNLLNLLALPFAGINTDFGGSPYFRAGYAIYVPMGGMASWDRRDGVPGQPGSTDGVNRWHNISGQILNIYNTFAGAVVIPNTGLSFGASISPVIQHVATTRARTADDSDDTTNSNGTLKEGRSYLDASGVNIAASFGAYWQSPDSRIRLGATYLSQPGFGTSRLSGTLNGVVQGGAYVKQDIDFLQTWPDIIRVGGAWRLPNDKVEIRSDLEYVRWSVFENQCVVIKGRDCKINADGSSPNAQDIVLNIPRNWKDAVGYRLGAGYFANSDLELFASGGFATSAVPKETIDASTIDAFSISGSLGARYTVSRHFAFAVSYNHIYYLPVDTKGANKLNEFASPSKSPSADGKYTSQIGLLNANASYTF